MSLIRSRRVRGAVVALAAGSLILTGCSSGSPGGNTGPQEELDASSQSEAVALGDAAASKGPADPVEGAQKGGTVRVYQESDFSHLDPGQIYVSDAGQLAMLIHRGLTVVEEKDDGSKVVVGDLATDSGTPSDGGKTWKYTLKDNIKDEDGDPITSEDVRHTFERLFSEVIFDGPTFIQKWLAGGTDYRDMLPNGPYKGDHLPDDVLETPNDKTIIFHFDEPKPDLPQALAMPGYSVVPKEDDTKKKYDQNPKELGPYKIGEYKPGKSMTLVRNEHWDPKTDPVRRAYPDKWYITFNHDDADQTRRILADQGEAQRAVMLSGAVAAEQIRDVITNAKDRTVRGFQPYVWQMNMNMDRIKDKKVRDAITYAMPNQAILDIAGGEFAGAIAPNLFAPTVPGYEAEYDPYGKLKHPNGQPEKAKKLLKEAGKTGMKLVYAFQNTPTGQDTSVVVVDALEKAGFEVQKKALANQTWYEQVGKVDNGYDIYQTGWGQDWASAATVIPPVYDGDVIADGASNYSHINDPKLNKMIDEAMKITDPAKATKAWQEAHHYMMEEVNPAVPIHYTKTLQIHGSKIGGAKYSQVKSYINFNQIYVKQ